MPYRSDKPAWGWFIAWALPGACIALAVSVPMFALPLAIALLAGLSIWRATPEALGAIAGLGVAVAAIGVLNLDHHSCSPGHTASGELRPGLSESLSTSCGGIDGRLWLGVGFVLLAFGVVLYRHLTD